MRIATTSLRTGLAMTGEGVVSFNGRADRVVRPYGATQEAYAFTGRRGEGAVERSGTSTLGVHPALRKQHKKRVGLDILTEKFLNFYLNSRNCKSFLWMACERNFVVLYSKHTSG